MQNKEVQEYRTRLLQEFERMSTAFCETCLAVSEPFAPMPGGWTVHQLAVHTRDVQLHVYGMRIRKTVDEVRPIFQNFDADVWMETHYDRSEPLAQVIDIFQQDVAEMLKMLAALPDEAWGRLSVHAMQGELTLQIWVERSLAHITEHLESVQQR